MNFSPIKTGFSFKGYDAAPLKKIYISGDGDNKDEVFARELADISKAENVPIKMVTDCGLWIQDDLAFVEKKGNKTLMAPNNSYYKGFPVRGVRRQADIRLIDGGNIFMGKKPDGEKWAIVGQSECKSKSVETISEIYDIKPENIFVLPEQNYHLDTYIRPIGYPYVLVDDPEITAKNVAKIQDDEKGTKSRFEEEAKFYTNSLKYKKYSSCDETVKKLEEWGFIPIRIAGRYGAKINFLNAIVNRHQDGTISYITGSGRCNNSVYGQMEEMFKEELQRKVPNLGRVYFVSGSIQDTEYPSNLLMKTLYMLNGGLHCMSLEEPDMY